MAGIKSLAKDTAIYGLSSIVGRFLNYLLVPLYTAVLPAASGGYGVVSNVYAYTALILVLLTFGMETGFFRFANKSDEDAQKVYANSLLFVGGLSLLFVVLCMAFLHPLSALLEYPDHPDYIAMMVCVVALDSFQCIPFAYLRYKKRPVKFAAIKLLNILGNILLNLFFLLVCPWLDVHAHETVSWFYNPDYLVGYIREHKLGEYLNLIKESKKVCDIPIIASINCYQDADWIEFAKKIEEAGADALEVNILALQTDVQYTYGAFEQRHIDILSHIKKTVNIPVIMKLGDNLTNPIALIDQLYANGAAAVVMFNRFYQPDIDIEKMAQSAGNVFSTDADLSKSLRWIGIASAAVNKLDYAASGGIHAPEGIVKAILAGASAVELCSALYLNSYAVISEYTRFLNTWMDRKGMENINQFKGMLNVSDLNGVNTFERTQFLKYFSSHK